MNSDEIKTISENEERGIAGGKTIFEGPRLILNYPEHSIRPLYGVTQPKKTPWFPIPPETKIPDQTKPDDNQPNEHQLKTEKLCEQDQTQISGGKTHSENQRPNCPETKKNVYEKMRVCPHYGAVLVKYGGIPPRMVPIKDDIRPMYGLLPPKTEIPHCPDINPKNDD